MSVRVCFVHLVHPCSGRTVVELNYGFARREVLVFIPLVVLGEINFSLSWTLTIPSVHAPPPPPPCRMMWFLQRIMWEHWWSLGWEMCTCGCRRSSPSWSIATLTTKLLAALWSVWGWCLAYWQPSSLSQVSILVGSREMCVRVV